ncbi:MAG: hypothetical protein JST64_07810, partial [Actinobacteria bacterium]|nr:hypothetical protein [Actinomycetota bacterium]
MSLNVATFLLQWATGGLAFLWVTTRRREVSLGYGWLLRGVYGAMALGALAAGIRYDPLPVRDVASAGVVLATCTALWVSVARRGAGVALQRERVQVRSARISEMTGIDRAEQRFDADAPEFPPALDVVAPLIGVVGLVAGGLDVGGAAWLGVARIVVGAAFLGSVTDAMLLGHWYLTQPGLRRAPLEELVRWVGWTWVPEVLLLLVPPGMVSVLNGNVDDG